MRLLFIGLFLAAISLLPLTGWHLGRSQAMATVVYLPAPAATPAACFSRSIVWGI